MVEAKHANEWSLADSAAHLPDIVEQAAETPQTITRDGEPVAIVVSIDEWRQKTASKGSLFELFQSAPEGFADLDFTRAKGAPRDIDL